MRKHKSSTKFLVYILGLFLGIILIIVAVLFFWWQNMQKAVDPNKNDIVSVVVPKGAGVIEIGNLLEEKKLIKNTLAFRLIVKKLGIGSNIQAGSFNLSQDMDLATIAQSLTKGTEDIWIRVSEGKRAEEVATIVAKQFKDQNLDFDPDQFLNYAKSKEGYLFPESYLIPKTMSASDLVDLMVSTFNQKVTLSMQAQAANLNLDFAQILVLASLVEREAKHAQDRPMIAGVLYNRLELDMPLQIDATVQYVKANYLISEKKMIDRESFDWWPEVLRDDLNYFESQYNTYLNVGIPPGPICNPGLASIKAALEPANHDYLYYVSQDSGETHFAKTLSEHEDNIAKYLR